MPDVQSSAIRHIRYDGRNAALYVTFQDGDVYRYSDVPAAVYEAFIAADSKGTFFAHEIRECYAYARVWNHSAA